MFPLVMSFKPENPFEYKNGLRKPNDGRPAFKRTSLSSEMNAEKVGVAAEVPPIKNASPPMNTLNRSDCAETSGIPYSDAVVGDKVEINAFVDPPVHWG